MPSDRHTTRVVDLLKAERDSQGYDGFVLEVPLNDYVASLFRILRRDMPTIVIVAALPPWQTPLRAPPQHHVDAAVLNKVAEVVDMLVVMTYDYMGTRSGVPNAPVAWAGAVIKALTGRGGRLTRKLLLGVPLYGYDEGNALLSSEIVSSATASSDAKVSWRADWAEHVVTYSVDGQNHEATIPTPHFVVERQRLAEKLGIGGIAYWELGQCLRCLSGFL
jgi:spore germination protein YaaH